LDVRGDTEFSKADFPVIGVVEHHKRAQLRLPSGAIGDLPARVSDDANHRVSDDDPGRGTRFRRVRYAIAFDKNNRLIRWFAVVQRDLPDRIFGARFKSCAIRVKENETLNRLHSAMGLREEMSGCREE